MRPQNARSQASVVDGDRGTRNPFGVMDVTSPNDQEVMDFAARTKLVGTSDDDNARAWVTSGDRNQHTTIEGNWCSRWNGGADPTISGDAGDKWKQGRAEVKLAEDRIYVLFDWNHGAQGSHRCTARGKNKAGWEVRQFDRSKNHTPLGRFGREQSKNRWTVVWRPSGFPPMVNEEPIATASRGLASRCASLKSCAGPRFSVRRHAVLSGWRGGGAD